MGGPLGLHCRLPAAGRANRMVDNKLSRGAPAHGMMLMGYERKIERDLQSELPKIP